MANYLTTQADGNPHNDQRPSRWFNIGDSNYIVSKSDNGSNITVNVDGTLISLPKVGSETAPSGTKFRFINTGDDATTSIEITTDEEFGEDFIIGTVGAFTANKTEGGGVTNSAGLEGDWIELTSNGSNKWFITGGVGVWNDMI